MFAHIVDVFLNFVQIYNVTALPVTIPRRVKLNSVIEYNQKKCYFVDPCTDPKLTFTGWGKKTVKIATITIMVAALLISPSQPPTVLTSLKQLPTIPMSLVSMTPVSTTVGLNHEFTFPCGVTVYGNPPKNDEI